MPVQLREVERKKVKFGEELLLPAFSGGKIYCRIFFTSSPFGKLLSLFHRPVLVRITGNMENGQGFSYDMPGRMGETYFLLSPLLETTSRMETYLKGGRLPGVEKILFTADHRFFSRGRGGNPIDLFLGRMAYCNTIEVIFYKETEYKK